MRYFLALAFCFLLASPQAHACHPGLEESLFFSVIPDPQPDADVIAKVSLSNVDGTGMAMATVMQVLKTSDARVRQGSKITMQFIEFISCGPDAKNGEEGIIIAKVATDSKDRLVLCPYTIQRRGRIMPPHKDACPFR
ncbi:MAG: hypothetical protein LBU11_12075 [Zoogloeaceae bacterium]|jgi:hypothetical protein|nr:hypothetical protein [Zoogloeaceae bacterium]